MLLVFILLSLLLVANYTFMTPYLHLSYVGTLVDCEVRSDSSSGYSSLLQVSLSNPSHLPCRENNRQSLIKRETVKIFFAFAIHCVEQKLPDALSIDAIYKIPDTASQVSRVYR
jgi:hypothetical protein